MTNASRKGGGGFLQDIISVSMARVIALAAFLVTNILIARYLGPEGKGLAAIFTAVPNLVGVIAALGMDKSSAYMIGKQLHGEDAILSGLMIGAAASTLCAIALSGAYFLVSWSEGYTALTVMLTMGVVVAATLQRLMNGVMLGRRLVSLFSVTRWLPQALQALVVLATILLATLAVNDIIVGMLVGFAAAVIYSLIALSRRISFSFRFDRACFKLLLSYGVVVSIADFLVFLNYKIQIFVLQAVSTVEQVGLFSLGQNFGELLWQAPGMMSAVILSRSANAADPVAFSHKIGVLLRLSLLVCAGLGIMIGVACLIGIPIVFGPAFAPSSLVYFMLLPGVVAIITFKILASDLVGQGKARMTALIMAPSVALNIGLGLALIPLWGAIGAAMAATVTYLAISVAVVTLYSRKMGQPVRAFLTPRADDLAFLVERAPFLRRLARRISRRK